MNNLLKEHFFRTSPGIGVREASIFATLDFMTADDSTLSSSSPTALWNLPATTKLKTNIINLLKVKKKKKKE